MTIKGIFEIIGKRKTILISAGGVMLGIILLLIGSSSNSGSPQDKHVQTVISSVSYTEALEKRIEELCTSIAGIQEATVLLTLENSTENVYAGNTNIQKNETSGGQTFDYILMNKDGGEEPVLITEIYPKIRGVAVVCTNGDDISVQLTITKLLSASLGIASNRIQVAGS